MTVSLLCNLLSISDTFFWI